MEIELEEKLVNAVTTPSGQCIFLLKQLFKMSKKKWYTLIFWYFILDSLPVHDSFQRAKIYIITGQMYRPKINTIISKFYIIMNSTKKKMKDFLRILYELKFYGYLHFALLINAHTGSPFSCNKVSIIRTH